MLDNRATALRQRPLWPYLELVRPPNLFTAAADVLAGFAVATAFSATASLPLLLLSGVLLYGGGVALNDACDAELDARERPERPIPSGRADRTLALVLAIGLLCAGVASAWMASPTSGALALAIALGCVAYDGWAKHEPLLGPLTIGGCRALNLLLGLSAAPALISELAWLGAIPLLHVAGVTVASHGEVHGGTRPTLFFALAAVLLVLLLMIAIAGSRPEGLISLPFLALYALTVLPPLARAHREPSAGNVRSAVGRAVLALIVLDAALAAAYAGPPLALAIVALLPGAILLSRVLAVT